mmetsp:Transcript_48810/g.157557  ORF Transcript_48810/g.157557 Transcript_48810/m.157557 type:complete len:95 (-) Transcript_48810:242-526(-)
MRPRLHLSVTEPVLTKVAQTNWRFLFNLLVSLVFALCICICMVVAAAGIVPILWEGSRAAPGISRAGFTMLSSQTGLARVHVAVIWSFQAIVAV